MDLFLLIFPIHPGKRFTEATGTPVPVASVNIFSIHPGNGVSQRGEWD